MATVSYTSLLGLALPTQGDLSGTWGTEVNSYITTYLDSAVAGVQTISGTQTAVTLSVTNGSTLVSAGAGATGSSQYMVINCTGTPASLLTITAPAASKVYVVINGTAQSVKLVGAGPTTGVTLITGEKAVCAWNGSDFVKAASSVVSALTGTLAAANGGTGLTASGSLGNVLTSNGTTWTSSAPAAGGIVYTTTKTANYTAVANDGVLTNTTAGAFTVTLPASPSNGDQVIVADAAGTWGTNNLTVGRNGNNIADVAQDLVCDIAGASVQFVYNSSGTASWEVFAQVGGNGGTVVTLDGTQTLTNKTLTAPTIASANLTTALTLAGAAGNLGQVLTSAGSGLPSWTTPSSLAAATQAEMEAASSNTVAATPLNTKYSPGVAKAWLKANGAGTTINASHNITSITDTGAGQLTVTIATDFSSANYTVSATAQTSGNDPSTIGALATAAAQAAGSVELRTYQIRYLNPPSDLFDPESYYMACFGDQA